MTKQGGEENSKYWFKKFTSNLLGAHTHSLPWKHFVYLTTWDLCWGLSFIGGSPMLFWVCILHLKEIKAQQPEITRLFSHLALRCLHMAQEQDIHKHADCCTVSCSDKDAFQWFLPHPYPCPNTVCCGVYSPLLLLLFLWFFRGLVFCLMTPCHLDAFCSVQKFIKFR